MRGEIIYKILNFLNEEVLDYANFAHAFLRSGYGATRSSFEHNLNELRKERMYSRVEANKIKNFKKYLCKLKKEGFILQDAGNKVSLSKEGKKKLKKLKCSFYLNKNSYIKKQSKNVIVISYDIPVAFNRERNILRDMLRMLDFNLIHKSVWIGKTVLPERFIGDLNNLGIIDYVEILEVTKNGIPKEKD